MKSVRTIHAEWFEVKSRVERMMDDGSLKIIRTTTCTNALTCTEAETRATENFMNQKINLEGVDQITRTRYKEVMFNIEGDKFYSTVVKLLVLDEKTEKIKKQSVRYLVQASTLGEAREIVNDVMSKSLIDYEIFSITESAVEEVLLYTDNE